MRNEKSVSTTEVADSSQVTDALPVLLGKAAVLLLEEGLLTKAALQFLLERNGFNTLYRHGLDHLARIDDDLRASREAGIEQLVIFGAGQDYRPYQCEALKNTASIFEVDHAAALETKEKNYIKRFGFVPHFVHYVAMDFTEPVFEQRLLKSGYDPAAKTLFLWQGVNMYVKEEALDQVMAFVASRSGEGGLEPSNANGFCLLRQVYLRVDYNQDYFRSLPLPVHARPAHSGRDLARLLPQRRNTVRLREPAFERRIRPGGHRDLKCHDGLLDEVRKDRRSQWRRQHVLAVFQLRRPELGDRGPGEGQCRSFQGSVRPVGADLQGRQALTISSPVAERRGGSGTPGAVRLNCFQVLR